MPISLLEDSYLLLKCVGFFFKALFILKKKDLFTTFSFYLRKGKGQIDRPNLPPYCSGRENDLLQPWPRKGGENNQ